MIDDIFDFGFTLVNETELEVVQQAAEKVQTLSTATETSKEKLDKLYNAIQPLLSNLKQSPEKYYILWPDRAAKVEQFSDIIDSIYSS
jgi:hypothetical protein